MWLDRTQDSCYTKTTKSFISSTSVKSERVSIMSGNNDFLPERRNENDILDRTLRDLQQDPRAKVTMQNGRTVIQYSTDTETIRVDHRTYSYGEERSVSITPRHDRSTQAQFEAMILERLEAGQTQSEIASAIGISQTRVSQIKRKHQK